MLLEPLLRAARITRYLPWLRGIELVRRFYSVTLPRPANWSLRVDDFDRDLKLDVDPREFVGISIWHRPELFEKKERQLFCSAIGPGARVLDVGANIGLYSLLAAKRGASVFAIEADPQNAAKLRHHIEINGFGERVAVFEFAAFDEPSTISLFRNPINSGGSNCFDGTDEVTIPANTIDSLGLPPIDICKMDIEGAEARAILGMQETITRSKGMRLFVEYNPTLTVDPRPLIGLLHSVFGNVRVIGGPILAYGEAPKGFCDLECSQVRTEIQWDLAREEIIASSSAR